MSRPSLARAAALAVLAALLAPLATACGGGDGAPATAGTTAPPATGATVTVYFVDDAGGLVAEPRPAPPGESPLEAAVRALAEGPSDPALVPALPPGTRLLGAGVAGGVATLDLSREFESGYPSAGSAAELAVLGPLVRTASEAAGTERVRILVEGRAPAPPGSQFDLSQPLSPRDVAAAG